MSNSYQEIIKRICLEDERFVVFTAENRAVVRELPDILGDRFIDVGITEQNMIGMAAGMALRGRIPICHALTNFLLFRAYEFIRNDVGIPNLPVKLSGWIPGFLSDGNGPTHQSLEDVGIMRLIPGIQIFSPSDNDDLCMMLESIWKSPHPSYLRVNIRPNKFQIDHTPFEIGKHEIIKEGKDVTLLTHGFLLESAFEASQILEKSGLSVGLVNLRTIYPMDDACLTNLVNTTQKIVIIEDHFEVGGVYSMICEWIAKNQKVIPLLGINMKNKWFKPGTLDQVLEYEGFTATKIAEQVHNFL